MNLLHDIFIETFSKRYYFSRSGRAYVEYVQQVWDTYSWKICFFHFSHADTKLNSYHDYEIVKFIKCFYSHAYDELIPMMRYAIEKQFVMSMNSLDEYTFVIKFWNENETIRKLFQETIEKNTGVKFRFKEDSDIRFFELEISVREKFEITKIIIYSEKDLKQDIEYKEGYIEKDNIFMTLKMEKYLSDDNFSISHDGILLKFQNPVNFASSKTVEDIYRNMEIPHPAYSLYIWFVEQWFGAENLYFTHNYSIPA